jgi:hypothetical protein
MGSLRQFVFSALICRLPIVTAQTATVIYNGTELFGDYTFPGMKGFAALLKIQTENQDGKLDRNDLVFAQLLLWPDKNHNGLSESEELSPVYETLEAIGLGWSGLHGRVDENGNQFRLEGWARKAVPGKSR